MPAEAESVPEAEPAPEAEAAAEAPAPRLPVDVRLPFGQLAALGLQHVLIMYTGCVTVPLVFGAAAGLDTSTIGLLINADLLVAGLITLVQSLGVRRVLGVRLPIVTGATFSALTPMILIAGEYGMPAVYGSMLAAGLFGLLVAVPFARIVRFFPPLVSGVVITVIGISLIGVAAGLITGDDPEAADYASPGRLGLALGVIVLVLLAQRFTRGFLNQVGVLIALVVGTLAAVPMGMTDFSGIGGADWVGMAAPFHFGAPQFPPTAVISMCVVMLVIFTESTASIMAVGEATGKRVTKGDLARGLAADGASGVLGGVMNAFLDTVFTQNVGLIGLTRVVSRYVTATAGAMLVVLGLLPKLGELVAALPGPVVGAAALVLFGTVTTVGINTLRRADLSEGRNMTIAAVALGVGLLPETAEGIYERFPSWFQIIAGSGITAAAIVAFTLNLLFHHTPGTRPAPARADGEPAASPAGSTASPAEPAEPAEPPAAPAAPPGDKGTVTAP